MTHQVSVPRSGPAPTSERASSNQGAPIGSLLAYTVGTLLVVASVTVAAVVVSRDDAPTSTGSAQAAASTAGAYAAQAKAHAAADTAAGYAAQANAHRAVQAKQQQYVDGIDPATDVPASLGLTGSATGDGSFQAGETARMQALAPTIDQSFQANETARAQALVNGINPATDVPGSLSGTATDGSYQAGETARMQALAPTIDQSFQANETARAQALVNGINPATDVPGGLSGTATDGSYQASETARMQALGPIDDSIQIDDSARAQALVNGINPATDVPGSLGLTGTATGDGSFQANETSRMLNLAPVAPEAESSFSSWLSVR
jgi:hypothetical protein